jgi:arylsulfatase A-like enzyme
VDETRAGLTAASRIGFLAAFGAVLGGFAGLIESILVAGAAGAAIRTTPVVEIAVFYAVVWAAVGIAVGIVQAAVGAVRSGLPDEPTRRAFSATFLFTLIVFVLVGSYVNITVLPSLFSRQSFLFDAAFLAGCAVLWVLAFLAVRRLVARRGRARPRVRGLALAAVALLAILVVLGVAGGDRAREWAPPAPRGPDDLNILLIVVDALRADHLGCYGYDRETSPTIDRLASEGVRFARAYAQGPRTKEATASLVTSLYPSTHNVTRLGSTIPEGSLTLTEAVRGAGYATAVASANPLVSPYFGFGRGVDYFYVDAPSRLERSILLRVSRTLGRRVRALAWVTPAFMLVDRLVLTRGESTFAGSDADDINRAFLDWLDGREGRRAFAYLHYMEPHEPYAPPPPFDELFDPDYAGEKVTHFPEGRSMILPFVEGEPIPETERTNMVAQYDGSIAYFDRELERLLEALEERGHSDHTLIVLTSDHGEEFFDHRGWGHGQSLYEELIRVPLILWCPRELEGGRVDSTIVRHVDLLPTILGAAGAVGSLEAPDFEGVNLWASARSGDALDHELRVFSEVDHGGHSARCLRDGDWKLIHTRFGQEEDLKLFDLASDPLERTNLAGERADVADAMLGQLTRIADAAASKERVAGTRAIDEETEEKLRALGYVE